MAVTTSNVWMMTAANGLTAGSTHSFQVDYVTTDGRQSPISPVGQRRDLERFELGTAIPFTNGCAILRVQSIVPGRRPTAASIAAA